MLRSSGSQITPNHNVLTLQQQQQALSTLPSLAPKQQPAGQGNKPPTSTVINMPKLMPRDSPKVRLNSSLEFCRN